MLLLTSTALTVATPGDADVGAPFANLSIGQSLALGLALVALRVAAGLGVAWQAATLKARVLITTRQELAHAYLSASWHAQHDQPPGKLQELLVKFAERKAALVQQMATAMTSTSNLAAMLLTALFVEPRGLLAAAVLLVALVVVLRPLRAAIRRRAKVTSRTGMAFAQVVSETSQLGLEMNAFQAQPAISKRVLSSARADASAVKRLAFVQAGLPIVYTGLAYTAVLGGLGVVIAAEPTDVAALGAVMIILLRSLAYGQSLQSASAGLQAGLPFLEVLAVEVEFFRNAERSSGDADVGELGPVRFEEVSYSYDGVRSALKAVDVDIGSREIVGIVGPSGGGKSTFVQLLLGLRLPTTGRILADGRPIETFSRLSWARAVTLVPQQPRLIAGTIEENIRFYREWVNTEEVELACRLANLTPDLAEMPDGLQTQVGELGGRLSGGQQQRLIIARALVERPQLLVLDEPTSALDVESETLIRTTLRQLSERMAIVVVAHRLSTLDICDRIMVIKSGEIVAFGTPDSLKVNSDFFRGMIEMSSST